MLCSYTRGEVLFKQTKVKKGLRDEMSSPWSPDSVLPSPSPRSADGGRWRSTGRQRGSRGSCNKNKHISCLYSTTTGGRTRSSSRSSRSRIGASQAIMLQSPSLTTTLLTELGRYLLSLCLNAGPEKALRRSLVTGESCTMNFRRDQQITRFLCDCLI